MKGTVLDNVRTVKDLGITVSDYLNWRLHISNITSKANKVLGLIKRVCKDLKDPIEGRLYFILLIDPTTA